MSCMATLQTQQQRVRNNADNCCKEIRALLENMGPTKLHCDIPFANVASSQMFCTGSQTFSTLVTAKKCSSKVQAALVRCPRTVGVVFMNLQQATAFPGRLQLQHLEGSHEGLKMRPVGCVLHTFPSHTIRFRLPSLNYPESPVGRMFHIPQPHLYDFGHPYLSWRPDRVRMRNPVRQGNK